MQNMDRRRQNGGREFLSLQSPHRASAISSQPTGETEAVTHQLDVKDKDSEGTSCSCQVQVLMLPSLWAFLVSFSFFGLFVFSQVSILSVERILACVTCINQPTLIILKMPRPHPPLRGQSELDKENWIQGEAGSERAACLDPLNVFSFIGIFVLSRIDLLLCFDKLK